MADGNIDRMFAKYGAPVKHVKRVVVYSDSFKKLSKDQHRKSIKSAKKVKAPKRVSVKNLRILRTKNSAKKGTYLKMRNDLFQNYEPTKYVLSKVRSIYKEDSGFNIEDHRAILKKWKAKKQVDK